MTKRNQTTSQVFTCGAACTSMGWQLHVDTPIDKAIAAVKTVFSKTVR